MYAKRSDSNQQRNKKVMPKRIQRKRVKGWKMPPNTVSVTRPGKWGNPFKLGDYVKIGSGQKPGMSWLRAIEKKYADSTFTHIKTIEQCLELYELLLTRYPPQMEELRGKDLACFCKEGQPCHGDILLKLANQ